MSVFDLLKKDHKKVSSIFKEIESTDNRKEKQELFKKLDHELTIHADFEEKNLYPLLKEADITHDLSFESVEEHKIIKTLLHELSNFKLDQDEWDAKITVLQENVEHHVDEEEHDLFPKAKKALDKETINQLTEKKEAIEGKVKVASKK